MVCGPTFCSTGTLAAPEANRVTVVPTANRLSVAPGGQQTPAQIGDARGERDSKLHPGALGALVAGAAVFTSRRARRRAMKARVVQVKRFDSSGTVTVAVPDVTGHEQVIQSMITESATLVRWLDANPTHREQLLSMKPATAETYPNLTGDVISELYRLRDRNPDLTALDYERRATKEDKYGFMMAQTSAGVVVGIGVAPQHKDAKRLACQQLIENLANMEENLQETMLDHCSGAAEVLEALSSHFMRTNLMVAKPFGSQFQASISGYFLNKDFVVARMAENREDALSAVGESLVQLIRNRLRIGKEATTTPAEWAENLQERKTHQTLQLPSMTTPEEEAQLLELLGSEADLEALKVALQEAEDRQVKRLEMAKAMINGVFKDEDEEEEEEVPYVAVRKYRVKTPEEEDWRRPEVKGKLPVEKVREEISKALERTQSVIVSGGTGSGKTTQLPQFMLDDWEDWEKERVDGQKDELKLEVGKTCEVFYEDVWYFCEILEVAEDSKTIKAKYYDGEDEEEDIDVAERVRYRPYWMRQTPSICVTQPRRIAAISLAQRVADERYGEPGGEIGHAVRGDTVMPNSDTGTIEYCTTGTLLKRMVTDPLLKSYNVVVLDEIHERDRLTDFVLILMREVLQKRPDLRLVLMSATLDVQTFVNFLPDAHVVEVPTGTNFPVEEIHLEDDYFAQFNETQEMLQNEVQGRNDNEVTQGSAHEFGVKMEESVREQVQEFMDTDPDADERWKEFSTKMLEGEEDHSKVNVEMLRQFLKTVRTDAEGADDSEEEPPPIPVMLEQIKQMANFNDSTRDAWIAFKNSKDCGESELTSEHLVEFLNSLGVSAWRANLASWMTAAGQTWWGLENAKSANLPVKLAEQVIMKALEEILETPVAEDDEIGTGSILCFCPGWAEILALSTRLEASYAREKMWVVKCHSSVDKQEQSLIFESAEEGKVKIVLATNIAESSVTINDVRVVVDMGLHKEMSYDPSSRISYLDTVWITQSNAVQRKGRAGRVRSGKVYRLYTRDQFKAVPWRPAPEMQRCNLAQTCLQIVALGRDPRSFLASAPDPPGVAAVETALAELATLGAIQDGKPPTMLSIGQVLCRLPLEPTLGKAMLLGTVFGVPQMTTTLLANSGRGVFLAGRDTHIREGSAHSKEQFCAWSDVVASLRAITEFERVYRKHGHERAQEWCEHHFLHFQRSLNVSRNRFQLMRELTRSGILDAAASDGLNPDEWGWQEEEWNEEGEGEEGEGGEGEEGEEGEGEGEEGEEGQEQEQSPEEDQGEKLAETEQESGGAIFESEENVTISVTEWRQEMVNTDVEVQDERLLVGILCSAFPSNMAYRNNPDKANHTTQSTELAKMSKRSVNCRFGKKKKKKNTEEAAEGEEAEVSDSEPEQPSGGIELDGPSWWLFNDQKMISGKLELNETTLLSEWDVALFGGLRSRVDEHGKLNMDNWIDIEGASSSTEDLMLKLRTELRQAPVWLSCAASYDKIARAGLARSQKIFHVLGNMLMGQSPDEEAVQYLKQFKMPTITEDDKNVLKASEEEREEMEATLQTKTVAELKVLLREMDIKLTGRKAELVQRLSDALIHGPEWEPPQEEWNEDGGEWNEDGGEDGGEWNEGEGEGGEEGEGEEQEE